MKEWLRREESQKCVWPRGSVTTADEKATTADCRWMAGWLACWLFGWLGPRRRCGAGRSGENSAARQDGKQEEEEEEEAMSRE